jgi:hypothetical protein
MEVLVLLVIVGLAMGGIGAYISTQKGREGAEGFFLGFLLGPLGLLIAVLMPVQTPRLPVRHREDTDPVPPPSPKPAPKPQAAPKPAAPPKPKPLGKSWMPEFDENWNPTRGH